MGASGDKRVDTACVNLEGDGAPGVKLATKRNSPWSHAEHLLYLLGLERHGRGAWRAIADNFCISRTPTQVASHAQKYFARQALTPAQRHKTRASIHDITCDTIHPLATAAHRDSIRQTLQRIVREGKDSVASGDSATDSSATSSNRSTPAKCLPVQDPIFRQVFAFTTEAMWPGSTSHGIVFQARPQPLRMLCAATPPALPQPAHGNGTAHSNASARGSASAHGNAIAHGNAAATPHGSFWAGPPPASHITPPAHAYVHSGPGMPPQPFPVVFATAGDQMQHDGNHQQPQLWCFMPSQGPGMHMWPHHFAMQGPATEVHGPSPAPTGAFHAISSSETHASPPEQAALSHAPTEAAASAGYVYQPSAGFAGGMVAPWPEGRRAGVSEASLSSPQLLPQPPGRCENPQMWDAQLQGPSPDNVRGTKRDSFEGVDQSQLLNVYVASSLSSKVAKGTKTHSHAAAPGMYMSPQPRPGLRFPHSPPQPGLRQARPLPLGSAPGLAPSATPPGAVSTSLPVNVPPRRTMYFTSACMQPASLPLPVAVPQYVLPHHALRPGNVLRPRGGGRAGGRCDQAASRPHAAMHAAVAWQGPPPISAAPTPWLELASARPPAHPQDPPPRVLIRRISQGVHPSPHAAAHAVDAPAPPASPRGDIFLPDAATQTSPTRAVPHAAAYSLPAPPPPPQPPNHNTVVPLAPLEGQVPPAAFTADVNAQGSSCGAPDQLLGEEPLLPSTVPGQGVEEAQDLAEMNDFMGYLLGTSDGPGDGACIGTNSWDNSHSRSGARAIGSGSGSGSGGNGNGMGGSDGVNSCHAYGPGCMPRTELP